MTDDRPTAKKTPTVKKAPAKTRKASTPTGPMSFELEDAVDNLPGELDATPIITRAQNFPGRWIPVRLTNVNFKQMQAKVWAAARRAGVENIRTKNGADGKMYVRLDTSGQSDDGEGE